MENREDIMKREYNQPIIDIVDFGAEEISTAITLSAILGSRQPGDIEKDLDEILKGNL